MGSGEGTTIVAGTGLLADELSGSKTAKASGHFSQQRYDNSYSHCMYAQGYRVPISDEIARNTHNQGGNVLNQPTEHIFSLPPTR